MLPQAQPRSPCRPPRQNLPRTSPTTPSFRFYRSPTSLKRTTPSRSFQATTTPVHPSSFNTKPHNVTRQPYANSTTINCRCQADPVQVLLLLTVVLGMPVAVCICITAIRSAPRRSYEDKWIHAKTPSHEIATCEPGPISDAGSLPDAEAAEAGYAIMAAKLTFAAETASVTEALGSTTAVCRSNEHTTEARPSDDATFDADVISVLPYSVFEPPSPCSSRRGPDEATTSKSDYGRPPPRSSRRDTNRGRPSNQFYRGQRAEPDHAMRNPFATLRAYPGSPPITSRRFEYGRPQGNANDKTRPRRPNRKQNWRPRQSKSSRATQLALLAAIVLTCTVTSCNATDPAAAPAASICAGASRTLIVLLFLLMNSLGRTFDSPHGETPPTDTTDADEIPLYTPQTDWRIISGPPAEYDLSLDVPLPTPPPPPSPSPPPPTAALPSTSRAPVAGSATPNFAAVFSRYPTDTAIFVVFRVYVILFETTTSAPSWMPAVTRYDKIRLTKVVRDASRRCRQAVIVINSDLPENTAVSIGRLLRQLNSVAELLLPNNPPFLLQDNAFAFISLRATFPAVVQTMTFAADTIRTATEYATHDQLLHVALQAVLSAPIRNGYSDEDVATSLSRRAPPPKEHSPGNSSQLGK